MGKRNIVNILEIATHGAKGGEAGHKETCKLYMWYL